MSLHLSLIDSKSVWEEFINTYSPYALFQTWQWGEVEKKAGHTVHRYQITEGKSVIGLAQIFVTRARRGTFLHIRHGPVWKVQKESHWQEFFTLLKPLVKKEKAWFIRVSPLLENTDENHALFRKLHLSPSPVHEVDAERCWVLDLDKSEEELLMGMRKTTRYEIRSAQKLNVEVKKTTDPRDLKYFFRLYEKTAERHGFVAHAAVSEEFDVFAGENKALLLWAHMKTQ